MEPILSSLVSLLRSGWRKIRKPSSPVPIKKRKLLHLFVSYDELGDHQKLVDLLAGKRQTITVEVPGSKLSDKNLVLPSDISREVAAGVIKFVFSFHQFDYCFDGHISQGDLVLTYTGDMRALVSTWDALQLSTEDGIKRDASSLAKIIRYCIFSETDAADIPVDMQNLLHLLENYSSELIEAVLQHPSLKVEMDALAQFEQLYMEFLQLKRTDSVKFQNIVAAIPYHEIDEFHWKWKARDNDYLYKVLTHQKNKSVTLPVCSADELVQCARALKADSTLWKFVDKKRVGDLDELVTRDEVYPDIGTDRTVFFQVCLRDMEVKYEDGGDALIENIRNNGQHLFEENALKELDPPECGYTILFKYFQIMHIFGHHYPRIFCEFFLGMHAQGCVPSSSNRNLSHLIKQRQ